MRRVLTALAGIVLLAALAACGSGGTAAPAQSPSLAIPTARCQQNQAAGTLTYLTGYHYQASASILEILAAEKLGYYDDVCLDVKIEPGNGDTAQAAKLLAAGKVQVAGVAEQDVIQTNLNGSHITGVSSYSDTGLDVLMTDPGVTSLKQLDGKTLGYKGYMPIAVSAMLDKAGVDTASLKKVVVGYDPTVLPRGQVQGLTGFLSNEPLLLKADGDAVKVWQPSTYGIASSLGSFAINPAFGTAHPTAVQDFLRATFHAFQYCGTHVDRCIDIEHGYAGPTDDATHEKGVWEAEYDVAKASPPPGGFGTVDEKNVAQLAALVTQYAGQKVSASQAQSYFDPSYVAAITKDGKLVWPAS
jgi:putative hydroxymethylpyrimidine transport system substrate-binding protein